MATDTFNFYQDFTEQLGLETHKLDTDVIKACLTNTAPTASHATYSQIAGELSTANGYTAGGEDCQITWSESSGTAKAVGVNVVWTASGAVGPFQYVIFYNDSATNKNLIGWVDYGGSGVTMASGDTFTLDIDATGGIFTLSFTNP